MTELRASIVTLGISSAGQNRDRFTSAGKILEKFPWVLPHWCPGSSHAWPFSLSPAKNEIKRVLCVPASGRVNQSVWQRADYSSSTAVVTALYKRTRPPSKIPHIDRWLSSCISNQMMSPIKIFPVYKMCLEEELFSFLEATFALKRRPLSLIDRSIHQRPWRSRTGSGF